MILFRLREWGSADWHYLSLHSEGEDGDEMKSLVASVIGSALSTSELHVQMKGEDDEWEELE